jgi:uncharacterized membrane protein
MEIELQTLGAFLALSKLVEIGGLHGLLFVADSRNKLKAASVLLVIS